MAQNGIPERTVEELEQEFGLPESQPYLALGFGYLLENFPPEQEKTHAHAYAKLRALYNKPQLSRTDRRHNRNMQLGDFREMDSSTTRLLRGVGTQSKNGKISTAQLLVDLVHHYGGRFLDDYARADAAEFLTAQHQTGMAVYDQYTTQAKSEDKPSAVIIKMKSRDDKLKDWTQNAMEVFHNGTGGDLPVPLEQEDNIQAMAEMLRFMGADVRVTITILPKETGPKNS